MKLFWIFALLTVLTSSALVTNSVEQTNSNLRNVFDIQNDEIGGHFELKFSGQTNLVQITSSESSFYVPASEKYTGYYSISSSDNAKIYVQIVKNGKVVSFTPYSFRKTSKIDVTDSASLQGSNVKVEFTVSNSGSVPGVVNFVGIDRIILPGEVRHFSRIFTPDQLDSQGRYSFLVNGNLLKKKAPTSSTSGYFLGAQDTVIYGVLAVFLVIVLFIIFAIKPKKHLEKSEIHSKLPDQEVLPELPDFEQNII